MDRTSGKSTWALTGLAKITTRSETARIIALNVFGLVVVAASMLRIALVPNSIHFNPFWYFAYLPVIGLAIASVVALKRRQAEGRPIPNGLIAFNVGFEALLPTALIAALWKSGTLPGAYAFTSPAIMAYAVILILSPLRLRPWACVMTGVLAGASHTALVVVSGASRSAGALGGPAPLLYTYGAWIVIGGLAAAFVARELCVYVEAAVSEAEGRRRVESEIAAAAAIQRGLLPESPPDIRGYQLAFWSRPAAEVGGDYYDWQPLPDGRFAVTLADVCGHGLGPALTAAFCRAYARAALDGRPGISEAIGQVNALLAADLPAGQFVTFVAAVVTPGSREVELLSAGHGPLLVHRAATREIELLNAHHLPLGIDAAEQFEPAGSVRLAEGDAIVLVTDGFFEWRRADGDDYGVERLKDAILNAPADPEQAIASLRTSVETFAGDTAQKDDLTAVVIRCIGEDSTLDERFQ